MNEGIIVSVSIYEPNDLNFSLTSRQQNLRRLDRNPLTLKYVIIDVIYLPIYVGNVSTLSNNVGNIYAKCIIIFLQCLVDKEPLDYLQNARTRRLLC